MGRTMNVESLEQKIVKAEQNVVKTRKAYESATAELKKLLDKRDAFRSQEIMSIISDSPLSYEEVVNLIRKAGAVKLPYYLAVGVSAAFLLFALFAPDKTMNK